MWHVIELKISLMTESDSELQQGDTIHLVGSVMCISVSEHFNYLVQGTCYCSRIPQNHNFSDKSVLTHHCFGNKIWIPPGIKHHWMHFGVAKNAHIDELNAI